MTHANTFTDLLVDLSSVDGTGAFTFGNIHATGIFSGAIVGGPVSYSGINFSFGYQQGVTFQSGAAPTFAARLVSVDGIAPVPEPATWAMMVMGFGAVGSALRRRPKTFVQRRYALACSSKVKCPRD